MMWSRFNPFPWWRRELPEDAFQRRRERLIRKTPPPTIWLFGKTGSGKSSVVRFLTGAEQIAIGHGFRPTTQRTDCYDFPDSEAPLVRFLDTRGLGEVAYDAEEDIRALSGTTHLVLVTQKLLDFSVEPILRPLGAIRRAAPDRPVLLALTCLHEAYPQKPHPPTYPFASGQPTDEMIEPVARAVAEQRERFGGMVDGIVPIDLTRPEDGFEPADYGGEFLRQRLLDLLPAAYRYAFQATAELSAEMKDLHERRAMSHVYGAAGLAAAASLSPIPWVDLPFLIAIQTRMVHSIAKAFGREGTAKEVFEMLTAGSAGFAVRMGARELLKFVPFVGTVTGGLLGAALGYSYTYGLGRACCWYYGSLREGHQPSREEIDRVFRDRWAEGWKQWKTRSRATEGPP